MNVCSIVLLNYVLIFGTLLESASKPTIVSNALDKNTIDVAITIPLDKDEYLYVDTLQISVNNPAITLSTWQSSVAPTVRYDATFKENRTVLEQVPTLRLKAILKEDNPLPTADVRIVYYTNKQKTAFEQLIPLDFAQKQNLAPQEEPTQEAGPSQEPQQQKITASNAEPAPSPASWLDYLKKSAQATQALRIRLLIAFLLGLLLSLTPCIYPMIPITIGILQANSKSSSLLYNFGLSAAYTVGIAMTFALLGLTAALAGHAFGSFMNNPWVIMAIVMLLIYSALSLFGFYEIKMPRFLSRHTVGKGGSMVAAFLFGAVSGTIATPCLSPGLFFMLTLVATLKNVWIGFLLLFIFAIGLSLPLLIIGTFSGSLAMAPRAGSWMIEIKYMLGFMLLGMCFYFLSGILPLPLLLALASLFLLIMGIFYIYHARSLSWLGSLPATLLGMACIANGIFLGARALKIYYLPAVQMEPSTVSKQAQLLWLSDYEEGLTRALQEHKKLFVFFHAPLCAACMEHEKRFEHNKTAQAVLAKFIIVSADLGDRKNKIIDELILKFSIMGAPTCLCIDPENQNIIKRWDGELDDSQFQAMIQNLSSI